MTRRSCVFASTTCTDTEALWVSEGLSLVLWSFAATVEGLFTSLCATVTDAGRPSCASNCMKQTLSSFTTSEPLSLTTLYLIRFSQISVLKKKKETLKDFRHSLIQERPALSLPVLFLISFFLNDLSRIQILSSVMPSPLPSFPSSWHKATLAVGRGCVQPNVASRVCLYAYSSAGLH